MTDKTDAQSRAEAEAAAAEAPSQISRETDAKAQDFYAGVDNAQTDEAAENVAKSYLDAVNFMGPDGDRNRYGYEDRGWNAIGNIFGVREQVNKTGLDPRADWTLDVFSVAGSMLLGPVAGTLAAAASQYASPGFGRFNLGPDPFGGTPVGRAASSMPSFPGGPDTMPSRVSRAIWGS